MSQPQRGPIDGENIESAECADSESREAGDGPSHRVRVDHVDYVHGRSRESIGEVEHSTGGGVVGVVVELLRDRDRVRLVSGGVGWCMVEKCVQVCHIVVVRHREHPICGSFSPLGAENTQRGLCDLTRSSSRPGFRSAARTHHHQCEDRWLV